MEGRTDHGRKEGQASRFREGGKKEREGPLPVCLPTNRKERKGGKKRSEIGRKESSEQEKEGQKERKNHPSP
jgi:hypothetical protein